MKTALILAAALTVGGCTTITKTNVAIKNASESAQLDKVCKLRPIAVAGFDLLRSQVEISDSVVSKVYATSAGIKTICDNRPTDIGGALATATKLYGELLASQASVSTAVAAKLGG